MNNILKNKKIIIVYNLKTKNYSENYSDFFSENELKFIFNLAESSNYPVDFIEGELAFIEQIKYYFPTDIVVLNLTRRGSYRNKKSTVTSICDLKQIPYIGSSTLSMNLCRNKYYLYPLLKQVDIKYPITINKTENGLENLINKFCIIKNNDSAGSLGLDNNSIKLLSKEVLNKISKNQVIQEYIEGYELEVPFFIKDSKVEILGVYMLILNNNKYYSINSDTKLLDYHNSDIFNYQLKEIKLSRTTFSNLEKIINTAISLLEIENYGRIDFRTSDLEDIEKYYIFDIATSPFFTKNSSLFLSMKGKNIFNELMETL